MPGRVIVQLVPQRAPDVAPPTDKQQGTSRIVRLSLLVHAGRDRLPELSQPQRSIVSVPKHERTYGLHSTGETMSWAGADIGRTFAAVWMNRQSIKKALSPCPLPP